MTEQEKINRLSAWFLQLDDAGRDIINDLSQKLVVFRNSFAESACISKISAEKWPNEKEMGDDTGIICRTARRGK
jgi:hypothetical protein